MHIFRVVVFDIILISFFAAIAPSTLIMAFRVQIIELSKSMFLVRNKIIEDILELL